MPTLEQFKNARSVLKGVIRETSLIDSPALSKELRQQRVSEAGKHAGHWRV